MSNYAGLQTDDERLRDLARQQQMSVGAMANKAPEPPAIEQELAKLEQLAAELLGPGLDKLHKALVTVIVPSDPSTAIEGGPVPSPPESPLAGRLRTLHGQLSRFSREASEIVRRVQL